MMHVFTFLLSSLSVLYGLLPVIGFNMFLEHPDILFYISHEYRGTGNNNIRTSFQHFIYFFF